MKSCCMSDFQISFNKNMNYKKCLLECASTDDVTGMKGLEKFVYTHVCLISNNILYRMRPLALVSGMG